MLSRSLPLLALASLSLLACSSNGGTGTTGSGGAQTTAGSGSSDSSGPTSGTGSSTGSGGASTSATTGPSSSTGAGAGMPGGCPVFPADNAWNTDISGAPVDPLSDQYVATIGLDMPLHPDFGATGGIPFMKVDNSVMKSMVTFDDSPTESDLGPYPIPMAPQIEDDGDLHMLMVNTTECRLYELFGANLQGDGWHAGSGAIWELSKNWMRPMGWTSADAAGLPIYPGLVRYDEAVTLGEIKHALRFTVETSQHAYVAPANHYASDDTSADQPPMGLRVRLKAGVDLSGYPKVTQVILTALKKYGMIVADNGGSWFISGEPNPGWSDDDLHTMTQLHGSDFEVITSGPLITN